MTVCDIAKPECVVMLTGIFTATAAMLAALVTAWMALETRRMAAASKRATDLEYLPLLGIREVQFGVGTGAALPTGGHTLTSVKAGIELFNAGRVPLRYRMKALRLTCAGRSTDTGAYLSRGAMVLPGSSMHFWSTPVGLDPPVTSFPTSGRISCVFEYWRNEDTAIHELNAELEYTLSGATVGSATHWLFVDEPPAT
jgi:hypothetical protein